MSNLKAEVLNFLKQEKPRLQSMGINAVGCFGSVVRGEDKLNSDIDILIDVQSTSTLSLISLIALEQEYTARLHHKVDLVLAGDLRPAIGKQILDEVEYV